MCYHKSPPNIAPFPATYHPQISPYAEYMTFGRLPANASFPAAAKSLNTAATLFAGPGKASNSTPSVSGDASFHLVIEGDMQTLSTQNAPKDGPVQGILFVPSLELNDPCNNITAPYIPANVTRYQDVSSHGYQTIGLAPWITSNCSKPFLDASSRVGTEALVFFLPVRDDAKPPPPDDPTWLLSGGTSLESDYPYPVYAIPGSAGVTLFEQLSRYPSNETFPQSQQNASSRGDGGYVRLYTFIDLEKSEKKTPSIWGFLLAIIGTVVVLSVILLLLYQFLQRRRREILQRRLAVGAADYQQFQLQHLKVPQELIARLPTYVYPNVKNHGEDCSLHTSYDNNIPDRVDNAKRGEDKQKEDEKEPEVEADGRITQHKNSAGFQGALDAEQEFKTAQERVKDISPRPARCETSSPAAFESDIPDANHPTQLSHSQTTCAICLDDFTPNSSIVRELPCGHIYHPECIDISLTRSSSLCPLCKKSVWAPEFYPIPTPQATHRHDNVRHPWLMTQM